MEDWVKVYSSNKNYDIRLVKGMLAENDIESQEISKKDSSFLIGGIDLYVHPEDEKKAREIIGKHREK